MQEFSIYTIITSGKNAGSDLLPASLYYHDSFRITECTTLRDPDTGFGNNADVPNAYQDTSRAPLEVGLTRSVLGYSELTWVRFHSQVPA